MTNSPFQDSVAIDTNVFEHLLNPQNNTEEHINSLLRHLQERGIGLLVDDHGRISGEYNHHIAPLIRLTDDVRNEIYILRYWMEYASRNQVTVDLSNALMTAIRGVILELSEAVDRIFVYLALSQGKVLVSNDEMHIVVGPIREGRQAPRRHRLLNNTRKFRSPGAEILTSQEAYDRI